MGCKILWLDLSGKYEVYDSLKSSSSPTTTGTIPADIKLPNILAANTGSIGSVVYFRGAKPDGIMSCDVVSGK